MALSQTKASWCVSIAMEIREANETGEHLLCFFFLICKSVSCVGPGFTREHKSNNSFDWIHGQIDQRREASYSHRDIKGMLWDFLLWSKNHFALLTILEMSTKKKGLTPANQIVLCSYCGIVYEAAEILCLAPANGCREGSSRCGNKKLAVTDDINQREHCCWISSDNENRHLYSATKECHLPRLKKKLPLAPMG